MSDRSNLHQLVLDAMRVCECDGWDAPLTDSEEQMVRIGVEHALAQVGHGPRAEWKALDELRAPSCYGTNFVFGLFADDHDDEFYVRVVDALEAVTETPENATLVAWMPVAMPEVPCSGKVGETNPT